MLPVVVLVIVGVAWLSQISRLLFDAEWTKAQALCDSRLSDLTLELNLELRQHPVPAVFLASELVCG